MQYAFIAFISHFIFNRIKLSQTNSVPLSYHTSNSKIFIMKFEKILCNNFTLLKVDLANYYL